MPSATMRHHERCTWSTCRTRSAIDQSGQNVMRAVRSRSAAAASARLSVAISSTRRLRSTGLV